ncbi:Bacteriophage lambda head decoration protein D [Escherichia coli]|nr:Bacteriophage lambda head decoration protein D [Escherichia coli]
MRGFSFARSGARWGQQVFRYHSSRYSLMLPEAGSAVGILVLPLEGTETVLTYYKSGTFATEAIRWPDSVDEHKKANAFAGSALSHAALP